MITSKLLILFYYTYCVVSNLDIRNDTIFNDELLRKYDCDRPWPTLDLILPIYLDNNSTRNSEWYDIFFRSVLLFWPIKRSRTTLRLLIDSEQKTSTLIENFIQNIINKVSIDGLDIVNITYNDYVSNVYRSGYDRQQYLMMVADNFTDAEYVGFVDTDALIHSYVDREDIFEDDKPVVHGRIGNLKNIGTDKLKKQWMHGTFLALGYEEPMICMSYFPVVIKTRHLPLIRERIKNKMQVETFDEAFWIFSSIKYSQFNIMCSYLYWIHRDEYSWYMHDTTPWWKGDDPAYAQASDRRIFNDTVFIPKPYVSMHVGARYIPYNQLLSRIEDIFADALCYHVHDYIFHFIGNASVTSLNILNKTASCTNEKYFKHMYRFEEMDFNHEHLTNATFLSRSYSVRQNRIKDCNHTYIFL